MTFWHRTGWTFQQAIEGSFHGYAMEPGNRSPKQSGSMRSYPRSLSGVIPISFIFL